MVPAPAPVLTDRVLEALLTAGLEVVELDRREGLLVGVFCVLIGATEGLRPAMLGVLAFKGVDIMSI